MKRKPKQKFMRKGNNKHQPKTTTETLNCRKKKQPTKIVCQKAKTPHNQIKLPNKHTHINNITTPQKKKTSPLAWRGVGKWSTSQMHSETRRCLNGRRWRKRFHQGILQAPCRQMVELLDRNPNLSGWFFVNEVHIWKIGSPCFCQGKFG